MHMFALWRFSTQNINKYVLLEDELPLVKCKSTAVNTNNLSGLLSWNISNFHQTFQTVERSLIIFELARYMISSSMAYRFQVLRENGKCCLWNVIFCKKEFFKFIKEKYNHMHFQIFSLKVFFSGNRLQSQCSLYPL